MKKVLVALMGMLCAAALVVNAQDATQGKKLTPEQKALKKEMLDKYDVNHDGKIDKTERAKMSKEDKQKMIDAGLMKSHKKSADSAAPTTPAN